MKIEKEVKTRPQYNFLIKSFDKNGTLGQNGKGQLTLKITAPGCCGAPMVQGEIKNGEETLNESVTGMVIRAACSPAVGGAVAKSVKQFVTRTHSETVGQPDFEIVRTRRNFAPLLRR